MKFGERLLRCLHPPWENYYIDYMRLKKLLNALFDLDAPPEDGGGHVDNPYPLNYDSVSTDNISSPHQEDTATRVTSSFSFQKELNHEIQKSLLFLMKSMGEMASDLALLSERRRSVSIHVQSMLDEKKRILDSEGNKQHAIQQQLQDIDHLRKEYIERVGSKLLWLLEFAELTILAIIKIVKKHDKFLARWEESSNHHTTVGNQDKCRYTRLRRQYLPRFAANSSDPNVRCLFLVAADAGNCNRDRSRGLLDMSTVKQTVSDGQFGGWDVIQFNFEDSLRELFCWKNDLRASSLPKLYEYTPGISSRSFSEIPQISSDVGLKRIFAHSSSHLEVLNSQPKADNDLFFEPILYQIYSSRRQLGQLHHSYTHITYTHEMIHLVNCKQQDEAQLLLRRREEDFGSVEKERNQWIDPYPTVSRVSKVLNLSSAGLYMCNYNIVAPTAGVYADLLGFNPANAGIIIGMTPLAVILSSVLYSWWSSYSYKRAILFASFCCMLGNFVYALALPCNSLKMVLLGRMLTGFGSARTINRRYIADYYSIEDRTSGMAVFVSASALGMAVGPGLAAALSAVAPAGSGTNSFWTIETAPGYVMFVFWTIYVVLNVMFFEEPDRASQTHPTGLESQATTATASSESSPLLNASSNVGSAVDDAKDLQQFPYPLLKGGKIPVLVSLALLILLKTVLEGISSSAPTVSQYYFHWGVHASGFYLALLASFVIPTNFVLARLSHRLDDRELMLGTLFAMLFGLLGFLVYGEGSANYSETRFVLFGLVTFAASNALEGPSLGLLSKTIPKSLAKGTFNAGLLATEAGTLGRVVGDFWLASATFAGLDFMVNRTFVPMCLMIALSILAVFGSYSHLQPRFEDEDDD